MSDRTEAARVEALLEARDHVHRLARRLLRDEHAAEDLAQQSVAAGLAARGVETGGLRAYLAGVTRHLARHERRGGARRAEREARAARPDAVPSAAQIVAREEWRRRVVETVLRLGAKEREVVLLRFFEGLPPRRIARHLGLPVETVKTRLKRGLAQLRAALAAEHGRRDLHAGLACLSVPALGFTLPALPLPVLLMQATKLQLAGLAGLAALLAGLGWLGVRALDLSPPTDRAAALGPGLPAPDAPRSAGPAREFDLPPAAARAAVEPPARLRTRGRSPLDGIAYAGETPAAAPAASTLRGRTLDAGGRPLAGVRVAFGVPDLVGREHALRLEALSAADGGFVVEGFLDVMTAQRPTAEKAGLVLASVSPFVRSADGGWEPLELVLVPGATLEVTLRDAADAPLAGRWVSAGPARAGRPTAGAPPGAERLDAAEPDPSIRQASTDLRRRTDSEGRVRFALPSGCLLAVGCEAGQVERSFERCVGDRLTGDDAGSPLVLVAGERRRVVATLGATLRLAGRVLDADRAPVPRARVRVLDGEPDESGWFGSRLDVNADDQGRFELALHDLAREDVLTVLAGDGQWVAVSGAGVHAAARRRLEVGAWLDAPAPLELVLEPLLSIQGRVVDEHGAPVSVVTWAVPPGAPYVLQKGALGFLPISANRSETGAFEVSGLRPGLHDVIVKRNAPRTYHRFPGIAAGTRDLVLEIGDDRVVRLRVVAEGAAPGALLQPVVLWHQLREPGSLGQVPAAGTLRVAGCDEARWPAGTLPSAPAAGVRSGNLEHALGRTLVLPEAPGEALERVLEPRQVGCYSIGVRGWDAGGRPYARRLTPPLSLSAGEWTFVVSLELAAALEGRLPDGSDPGLWVEVRDAAGQPVLAGEGQRWTPVAADGSFRRDELPPGALDVRAGTRRELEAGSWRLRGRVTATPGEATVVRLR